MTENRPTSFDLRDKFLRSFTGEDATRHGYLKAAVDRDLRQILASIPQNNVKKRKAALQSEWDKVEHIHSWISSSVRAHNLYKTNPENSEAEYVHWLEKKDKKGRPRLLLLENMDKLSERAETWSKERQAKINLEDLTEDVTVEKTFLNGYRIVRLHSTDDLRREGKEMGHCVGDGAYDDAIESGKLIVYSLRDENNEPHATIGVRDNVIEQSKGKSNTPPVGKYMPYLQNFFNERQFGLTESIANTGMVAIGGTIYPFENVPAGAHFDELNLRDCYWLEKWPEQAAVKALTIGQNMLEGDYLLSFYASLPSDMVALEVKNCNSFDVIHLPTGLTSLKVWSCNSFDGDNLPTGLISLDVRYCDSFDGDNLPTGLAALDVTLCNSFDGHNLPAGLTLLEVWNCRSFDGYNLPAGLKSLEVRDCRSFDPNNFDDEWQIENTCFGLYKLNRKSDKSPMPIQGLAL